MKKLAISIVIPLLILWVPSEWIPIVHMSTVEHRLLAIFVMAVLFWVLEPIPIFATSVLIIMSELLLISDQSLSWLRSGSGTYLPYDQILKTFASPIILLFIGGFFLALAATKYRLDLNLARVLLKPFGQKPRWVMLGLMAVTAVFSMFMSNTATTAMMLAVLTPLLKSFGKDDPGKIAFALCVPFAANVGGIGTPIGTPPNAVAMKYLTGEIGISFGEWMSFGVPYALIMLGLVWGLLLILFPPKTEVIELKIQGKFLKTPRAILVYATFLITIGLWVTGNLHGLNSYVVAMIPVTVFVCTRIVTKEELKKLNWDVLWLISGGIALGLGLEKTGLSRHFVESIPFQIMPAGVIVLFSSLIAVGMATFMSNTATANLILPVMAALASSLPSLEEIGGDKMLLIVVTFSCSVAMAMPISTPPNALAYATGMIGTKDMLKSGLLIGFVALLTTYGMAYLLKQLGFF